MHYNRKRNKSAAVATVHPQAVETIVEEPAIAKEMVFDVWSPQQSLPAEAQMPANNLQLGMADTTAVNLDMNSNNMAANVNSYKYRAGQNTSQHSTSSSPNTNVGLTYIVGPINAGNLGTTFVNLSAIKEQHRNQNDHVLVQRKNPILGIGAGLKTDAAPKPNYVLQPVVASMPRDAAAGDSQRREVMLNFTRSPLVSVSSNSYPARSMTLPSVEQVPIYGNNKNMKMYSTSGTNFHQFEQNQPRYLAVTPSLPSTSQQAAVATFTKEQQILYQHQLHKQTMLQRQHLQQQRYQQEQQQLQVMPPTTQLPCASTSLDDRFFLCPRTAVPQYAPFVEKKNYFELLSDEIILQIFQWLPKKALLRCSSVCRRFNRCARDESLWIRLDLGSRFLRAGAMEQILTSGVVVLRLAQADLKHPVFEEKFLQNEPDFEAKLQYLDLSMATITKPSLKLLLGRCRQLKKLSLEHVPLNDEICDEIAENVHLEALNLTMCTGLEAWSIRKMMEALQNLNSLNISWTNLQVEAVTSLTSNVTPNIMRLNIAGCRKTMFDSHLDTLQKRCPSLLELDLSDCTGLTGNAIQILCKFKMLEYLSLSRCYQIPASKYIELKKLKTLSYLDVFGILTDVAVATLEQNFSSLGINKFIHSSVARPTVGTRRTSIWGLRTRD